MNDRMHPVYNKNKNKNITNKKSTCLLENNKKNKKKMCFELKLIPIQILID